MVQGIIPLPEGIWSVPCRSLGQRPCSNCIPNLVRKFKFKKPKAGPALFQNAYFLKMLQTFDLLRQDDCETSLPETSV